MKRKPFVLLAYSGGLDTSIILHWIINHYGYDVVTFTADVGQDDDLSIIKQRALSCGAKDVIIKDLREEFVADYVFPMFRGGAIYEAKYLLGTAICRAVTSKAMVDVAKQLGITILAHGATGKGNDQVRFETTFYSMMGNVQIIAPWREWDMHSRQSLLEYAKQHHISIDSNPDDKPPYSMDSNILHLSIEGGILENILVEPPDDTYIRVSKIEDTPEESEIIKLDFECGNLKAINDHQMSPVELLQTLNVIGGRHGIGRVDLVENRLVGMKSRGIYETPGGTILFEAHKLLESIVLDREERKLLDEICPKYSTMIYDGLWFTPERLMLQELIDKSQERVTGTIVLRLIKGNMIVVSRDSPHSCYSHDVVSFDVKSQQYNQKDAEGFIKLHSLRFRTRN